MRSLIAMLDSVVRTQTRSKGIKTSLFGEHRLVQSLSSERRPDLKGIKVAAVQR